LKLSKNVIESIITGLLIIVLIVFLGTNLRRRGRRSTSKPGPPAEEALYLKEEEALVPSGPSSRQVAVTKEGQRKWGRDPFFLESLKEGVKVSFPLRVTGIIFDKDRSEATYAIINDVVVRVGDEIAGAEVIDIQSNSVTLRWGEKESVLTLREELEE